MIHKCSIPGCNKLWRFDFVRPLFATTHGYCHEHTIACWREVVDSKNKRIDELREELEAKEGEIKNERRQVGLLRAQILKFIDITAKAYSPEVRRN